jgi:hypothetical protein
MDCTLRFGKQASARERLTPCRHKDQATADEPVDARARGVALISSVQLFRLRLFLCGL